MAQRSHILSVKNRRSEVVRWPAQSETGSQPNGTQELNSYGYPFLVADHTVEKLQRRISRFARSLVRKLRNLREHRPLYLVGVVAGAGFAAGALLRVWRSQRHA